MRLVVDAGTTKTASALIKPGTRRENRYNTSGINPVTDPGFDFKIHELFHPLKELQINEVFYYGSGCINTVVNDKVSQKIKTYLPKAIVYVNDDLLGACIATSQKDDGITAIVGTGSNIGYYDGRHVIDGIKSCGYLIGDEGSGFKIGQEIYRRYARNLLNDEQTTSLSTEYNIHPEDAVSVLYGHSNPRQILASYASFIHKLDKETQTDIVNKVFEEMITNMIIPVFEKYRCKVHFVGSIAFHFQQALRSILKKNDIIAGSFIKDPLDGLIKHHSYE